MTPTLDGTSQRCMENFPSTVETFSPHTQPLTTVVPVTADRQAPCRTVVILNTVGCALPGTLGEPLRAVHETVE